MKEFLQESVEDLLENLKSMALEIFYKEKILVESLEDVRSIEEIWGKSLKKKSLQENNRNLKFPEKFQKKSLESLFVHHWILRESLEYDFLD